MIPDKETNKVYFSNKLKTDKRSSMYVEEIETILTKHNIEFGYLEGTKDIWCRDYMPIQIEKDKFMKFNYEPSYLNGHEDIQSEPYDVVALNGIKPTTFSSITLDGGNVVRWENKAILTDRIFDENPAFKDEDQLINYIEDELKANVLLIPTIEDDLTGHADGHVRFIDENTILANELDQEEEEWQEGFLEMIEKTGLKYVEMPWFEHADKKYPDTAIGVYVNYLEVGNLILFPIFEIEGNKDAEALKVIESVFPDREIETINVNEIGNHGGLLNCVTWTIKK